MSPESPVRSSRFAGTWYPSSPGELSSLVDGFLEDEDAPDVPIEGELVALVSPHAGLVYSGRVAAAGYRLLRGTPIDTVVLLGPSHRTWFDGLSLYAEGAFATPLGRVPVDAEMASALARETTRARAMPDVHRDEHCLEMQLPFLQRVLPSFRIVPVMMGEQDGANVEAAFRAIVRAVSETKTRVLVVASSDLSHYESRERARALDGEVLDCIERFDPEALSRLLAVEPSHACGGGPIVSVMRAARELGATSARVLRYGDSGDVSGDTDAVVGYVSAAFSRKHG
jgi:AmmeMemoRadiSam system protein B